MSNFNRIKKSYQSFYLLLLFSILASWITPEIDASDKNGQEPVKATSVKRKSSNSYCGLYDLYTVMKLADKKVDFQELLKPEYIGSYKGSLMVELKRAAEDHGMYAQLASKLTSRELCHSPYPIILHVKSTVDKKKYDHYELFLRAENDKAVLFDPPESIRAVSFRELAPCWDGYGIIVSVTPIDTGRIFVAARKQFIIYTAIVSWIVLMVRWGRRRWLQLWVKMSTYQLSGFSMAQSVGLVITALVFGVIYHFGNDEGFLAHTDAVSAVQQAHAVNFIPKIDVDKVRRLLDTDMIFIDARLTGDFEAGHLEGAINVPVDSNDTKRHKALTNIAKDSRIVLYCQSSECEFAEIVANQLASDGFTNLSIFKGGWQEWQTKNN